MQLTNRIQLAVRILCGLAFSACLLMAQADPPGRVARMSYMYGPVSFLPGGVDDWAAADYNRPLTTGDHVFVDFGGTAELQTGAAALRLGTTTALEILNLDDSNAQLRLTEGSLIIRLRSLGDQDSFEVDTPNLAFSLLRPGEYRIDVQPDSSTTFVTVRGGAGELTGPNQAFTVPAGEQAQVVGVDQPSYQTAAAPPRDQMDTWSAGRDQRDDQSPSARYVSRELVGYQDLDQYGSWRNTPDYGAVWVPNSTPDGWAPYHYGHWVWVDPWGWTWVDDAPWGFAPFHYGRWAYVDGYWGWVPGPVAERPVYAPALVAWVGGGAVGGGVAWFALGPREVYVPAYHTSPVYLNRVNVTNTVIVNNNVNITNVNVRYVNRGAPGAVMAVQQSAFASARPVQSAALTIRPEAIRSAPVVAAAAIAPTKASVARVGAPGARVAQPPAAVQSRPVIARRTPPPAPVPFAQKQQALATNAGRPLDTNQVQQIRQSQPATARPLVRQVQAQAPTAAPPHSPAGQFNRPSVAAPPAQRTASPSPVSPAPAPTAATPAVSQPARQPVPQTARPLNDRPAQNQLARPAQPPPPPESPSARPAPPVETKPADTRPATPTVAPPAISQPARQPAPQAAPQPARPLNDRPQNQLARPAQPPPSESPSARPAPPQRQAAPPSQPAPSSAQRPAPAENRPAPKQARPAPKKEDEKKDDKK